MKQICVFSISLLITLFIGLPASPAEQYDPEVYQAQKALKNLGYNPGSIDGLWGKSSRSALMMYQQDVGLPVTGVLDAKTKAKLRVISKTRSIERAHPTKERRLALVIGNSAYKSSPLINPVNDAQDIANTLRHLGFEVMHKENADQRTMEDAIFDYSKSLKKGGVGLFYYAGHGVQVYGRNYLIPIKANIRAERDIRYEAVDAGRVLDGMYDAGNGLNIVLLDACRHNPFARSFRASSRGLAQMDAPTGTFIAYATAPGSIAADGLGRNGIFTHYLLNNLTKPGLKIEDVMKHVRNGVMQETGNKQVPWQVSSLTGDFYFVSGKALAVVTNLQSESLRTKASADLEKQLKLLELKRQELERLKIEVEMKKLEAEQKLLEAEKQKLEVAKLPPKQKYGPPDYGADVVEQDGRYIKYRNGVVLDTKTGLEWVAGPNRDMTWDEAKSWAIRLAVGGAGWRMPTKDELQTLYQKGLGTRNMTPLLMTTGWWVWSGNKKGAYTAWGFVFVNKNWFLGDRDASLDRRGFAVRSRNDG